MFPNASSYVFLATFNIFFTNFQRLKFYTLYSDPFHHQLPSSEWPSSPHLPGSSLPKFPYSYTYLCVETPTLMCRYVVLPVIVSKFLVRPLFLSSRQIMHTYKVKIIDPHHKIVRLGVGQFAPRNFFKFYRGIHSESNSDNVHSFSEFIGSTTKCRFVSLLITYWINTFSLSVHLWRHQGSSTGHLTFRERWV